MPYSCVSEGLDLVLMVLGIWKQLRITVYIILYNFCYNNIGVWRLRVLIRAMRGEEHILYKETRDNMPKYC